MVHHARTAIKQHIGPSRLEHLHSALFVQFVLQAPQNFYFRRAWASLSSYLEVPLYQFRS